ncbi:histidine phosphatase family protein [Frigidibacter sp.]|uniref:histidine phosphatase family protein n=1 Tax=Frigidibacter sp. TaxID=2586418 RepID=UPI003524A791
MAGSAATACWRGWGSSTPPCASRCGHRHRPWPAHHRHRGCLQPAPARSPLPPALCARGSLRRKRKPPGMKRLLLVRRGESTWNAVRRLQGQADMTLTTRGEDQARALSPLIARLALG